jgi:hypothetical protein
MLKKFSSRMFTVGLSPNNSVASVSPRGTVLTLYLSRSSSTLSEGSADFPENLQQSKHQEFYIVYLCLFKLPTDSEGPACAGPRRCLPALAEMSDYEVMAVW